MDGPVEVDETYMGGKRKNMSNAMQGFVTENTDDEAQVYTDEATAYQALTRPHDTVKHSVSVYVNGMAHTNGIESFWAVLKRGYHTFHHLSAKGCLL